MKKIFLLVAFAFLFISKNITAQCTSCNIIISGMDAANHIIVPGDTFCITSTGTCTGLLTVSGGMLCNQGHINSSKVFVSNGGTFANYGIATIDSLSVTNNYSSFHNLGTLTDIRFAITDYASVSNTGGKITCDYFLDSLGIFNSSSNGRKKR